METNDHEVQVCLTNFEDLTVNLRCKTGIKVAVFNYFFHAMCFKSCQVQIEKQMIGHM